MTTVQEIEKAVVNLPRPELKKFREWFDKFNAETWDRQFESDILAGKLNKLADQALKDHKEGRCTEL
ncbi:MAG: hypothetical protein KAT34_04770 [Candidatus Aminicenantes bacterium]|nr:hypothetical protein [Candidatus Aminicenantes bacterium]